MQPAQLRYTARRQHGYSSWGVVLTLYCSNVVPVLHDRKENREPKPLARRNKSYAVATLAS
jgi:hypothetical protein